MFTVPEHKGRLNKSVYFNNAVVPEQTNVPVVKDFSPQGHVLQGTKELFFQSMNGPRDCFGHTAVEEQPHTLAFDQVT